MWAAGLSHRPFVRLSTNGGDENAEKLILVESDRGRSRNGSAHHWPRTRGNGEAKTEEIIVSATRIETPIDEIGSSVTVITDEEIARNQQRSLPDVLQTVPGLNVVQTGGPGGKTSVFMRGSNSNHTNVLIDGVDANDPSQDGVFDMSAAQPIIAKRSATQPNVQGSASWRAGR